MTDRPGPARAPGEPSGAGGAGGASGALAGAPPDEDRRAARERILAAAAAGGCRFVDLQFTDVTGALKSVVLPATQLRETLDYGHWFDGSALEGAARLMETDLLLRPDLGTWALLPWAGPGGEQTARLLCDVQTPEGGPFPADPRAVLARAVESAREAGFAYLVGAEVEFFLFRQPRGPAAATVSPLQGGPADHGGYFDLATAHGDLVREEMVQALGRLGVPVEASHHEIGPGQHEIDLPLRPALAAADAIMTCKYVVKTVARRRGLLATFMPKPLADAAGSGLHLLQALLDGAGRDAFAEPADERGLSSAARAFIAGQLAHARAMCAVLAPAVNSYKRLGRGFDAPAYLTWGHTNPLAVVRVPRARALPRPGRPGAAARAPSRPPAVSGIELRCADPSCNPYLALAVALAAGLDGIRAGMAPPAPVEARAPDAAAHDERQVAMLPASLGEAIQELEWDPVVRDALGAPVFERLLLAKEREWQEYRRQVSAWEVERYFEAS